MGDRRRTLNPAALLGCTIPLPPLPEQRRIVARIEELEGKVALAQALHGDVWSAADSLVPSRLSQITRQLQDTHPLRTLEESTTFLCDINHEMPDAVEEGVAFISPKDFTHQGSIDFKAAKRISYTDYERLSRKCRPERGDILMARYGTIGAVRLVQTAEPFLASYSIAVIRPDRDSTSSEFLFWMLASPYTQDQATQGIRGSGMADLGLKTIRSFRVPVLDKDEQRKIVAEMDALQAKVDVLKRLQAETQAELDAVMSSILDRAFRGEL